MRVHRYAYLFFATAIAVHGLRLSTVRRNNYVNRNIITTSKTLSTRSTTLHAAKRFYGISKPLHNNKQPPAQQLQTLVSAVVRVPVNLFALLLAILLKLQQKVVEKAIATTAASTSIAGNVCAKITSIVKKRKEVRMAAMAKAEEKAKLSKMIQGMDSYRKLHDEKFRAWTLNSWREMGIVANKTKLVST